MERLSWEVSYRYSFMSLFHDYYVLEVVGYRIYEASFWRTLVCDVHGIAPTKQRTRCLHQLVVL